jgi:hypothetical protein
MITLARHGFLVKIEHIFSRRSTPSPSSLKRNRIKRNRYALKFMIVVGIMVIVGIVNMKNGFLKMLVSENIISSTHKTFVQLMQEVY